MSERRALTPDEVAERWGCSVQHIYNLARRGSLRSFRLGKLLRFSTDAVLECEDGPQRPMSSYDQWKQARESKARRSA
jgi:excisionase family DNA binding protein